MCTAPPQIQGAVSSSTIKLRPSHRLRFVPPGIVRMSFMRLLLTAHSHDDQRLHRSNIYRHQARPQAKSGSWSAGRFASERWPIGGNIVKNILVSTLTLAAAFATNLPAKALS